MEQALAIAPDDAAVHSMYGFVQLGLRHYDQATEAFERSISLDPGAGDPRLGLGLCAYARGDAVTGLREILTATLLDPRTSQFQSMLGKALFQSRAFAKALETLDYAAHLDPNDPTPHLYKGIMLTDLNRPGEAIREINTSIVKNDNRAVFRSSLMLDRDLAVRNANLARSYASLGLGEWSFSKALTAVKNDPRNPSAHLFLSSVFASTRQRTAAAGSELLLFRLLSPANQNTFSGLDYTPMFESPYARLYATGTFGAWSNGNPVARAGLEGYGGVPGFAADAFTSSTWDEGLRDGNADTHSTFLSGMLKWEPTVTDAVFASASLYDTRAGDTGNLDDWTYANSPDMDQQFRNRFAELGYTHRFSPESSLLLYARQGYNRWEFEDYGVDLSWWPPYITEYSTQRNTSLRSTNFQAQHQLELDTHTILTGIDWFRGAFRYAYDQLGTDWEWGYDGYWYYYDDWTARTHYTTAQNSLTVYAIDYWKPIDSLVVELGLSLERVAALRYGYEDTVTRHLPGLRFGLNWQATPRDVLRLAAQRYLNTHMMYQNTLQPADVAGFPSWINADDGTETTEAGLAWERQWNDLTYSVIRLNAHSTKNPQHDATSPTGEIRDVGARRLQAQASLNRMLTPRLGLWGTASAKRLLPNDFAVTFSPNTDFSEGDLGLGLSYLHESGFGASASGLLVHQIFHDDAAAALNGDPLDTETFPVFNAGCSYLFPDRRGRISLEVRNILDRHFSYQQEMVTLDAIYPSRQMLVTLSFFF